jgi:hypothetical protein
MDKHLADLLMLTSKSVLTMNSRHASSSDDVALTQGCPPPCCTLHLSCPTNSPLLNFFISHIKSVTIFLQIYPPPPSMSVHLPNSFISFLSAPEIHFTGPRTAHSTSTFRQRPRPPQDLSRNSSQETVAGMYYLLFSLS